MILTFDENEIDTLIGHLNPYYTSFIEITHTIFEL